MTFRMDPRAKLYLLLLANLMLLFHVGTCLLYTSPSPRDS